MDLQATLRSISPKTADARSFVLSGELSALQSELSALSRGSSRQTPLLQRKKSGHDRSKHWADNSDTLRNSLVLSFVQQLAAPGICVHCDDSNVPVVQILGRVRCLDENENCRQSSISYCMLRMPSAHATEVSKSHVKRIWFAQGRTTLLTWSNIMCTGLHFITHKGVFFVCMKLM